MEDFKSFDLIEINIEQTKGLTSARQLIDTTSSSVYYSDTSTTVSSEVYSIIFPFYEEINFEVEKNAEEIIKEFESIIENKTKKIIDIKKIYYEQFGNDVF